MYYVIVLEHQESQLRWVGMRSVSARADPPRIKNWKWCELLRKSTHVRVVEQHKFTTKSEAQSFLRAFRSHNRTKTSALWVNSDCFLDRLVPYVYMIEHVPTGALYLGAKYSKEANPSMFGARYRTSSARVHALGWDSFRILEIRASPEARTIEHRLLTKWHAQLGSLEFCRLFLNRNLAPGVIWGEEDRRTISERSRTQWARQTPEQRLLTAHKRSIAASGKRHTEASKAKNRGAHLGKTHSDATKAKCAAASTGRRVSEKTRAIMRTIAKERTFSVETRQKMSQAKLGKTRGPHSEETKQKMRAAKLGHPVSELTRLKLSQANIGKKHSAETLAKMRNSHKAHLTYDN